ncbi:MAG TPA: histidine kinase dimerization/phosphoacceptor domain-containing protein [Kineosporiaceae bacterium]
MAVDMHDLVAHSVTLMVLHAGVAARLVDQDPAGAQAALKQVDALGETAVVELHHLLRLLGSPSRGPGHQAGPVLPGWEDIAALVERARTAGLDVRLEDHGLVQLDDREVGVVTYRVIQEA